MYIPFDQKKKQKKEHDDNQIEIPLHEIFSIILSLAAGSSKIKVKDEETGAQFDVGAHNLSSGYSLTSGSTLMSLLLLIVLLHNSIY